MSDLCVISYPDEDTAAEVRRVLAQLQVDDKIVVEDAVVAIRGDDGKLRLRQYVGPPAVVGAATGAASGALIGMLFLAPALGALVGAGAGAVVGAFSDYGIDDDFIKEIASAMHTDRSALFVLAHSVDADAVLEAMQRFGGRVMVTTLSQEGDRRLREALEAARRPGPGDGG
ncbi:MAG TPA: DUF1269 domain-containing protein [Candidatus Limnocylindrales bacterium]|nr:DUF1269 domain-containing protein [Candidatus Limnocylindrales bacterium]